MPVDGKALLAGAPPPLPAWRVFMVMLGVSFTSNLIVSLVAPILPWHLGEIGVSQIWCGIMFAMFPFATLLATPFTKIAMVRFGRIPLLFTGLLVQSVSTVAFGFGDELTGGVGANPTQALTVFVVARAVCGVGASLANTAVFAIAVERFGGSAPGEENRLGEVNGWNEVAIGVGFTLGPPFGNALYLSGGFKSPFVVTALILLVFSPCAFLLSVPATGGGGGEQAKGVGLMQVLKPGLLVPAGSVLLGTAVFGLVEPVLSLYLEDKVGVSAAGIGPVFGLFALTYSASSPLAGMFADKFGAARVCAAGTFLSGAILLVLLGPAASLSGPPGSTARITWEVVCLGVLGVAQAGTLIPTLSAMSQGLGSLAEEPGAEDNVAAWFVIFLNLGLSIGPVVGTFAVNSLGFENAMGVSGLFIALYGMFAMCRRGPPLKAHLQRKMSRQLVTIGTPTPTAQNLRLE